ncbi:MAG: hypothetical protein CBB84_000295 [Phycisphaera sp. TMED24]|nr:MAG: hypothetical protein CBB84_000295 [Phycisphaera sp. TMED24]
MATTKKISATEAGKALKRLLSKAKNAENPFPGVTDATQVLIQSFLVWEWNGSRASSTWARMVEDVTDLNELRVTVVDDYLEYFGGGCPRAEERADRLRATLRGVFHREHSTDLSGPAGGPKKEFREYLDSLEGMTPFVAARTALIAASSHAVPVDERTLRLLVKSGVIDSDATVGSASQTMSRLVTAAQGLETHLALQMLSEKERATPVMDLPGTVAEDPTPKKVKAGKGKKKATAKASPAKPATQKATTKAATKKSSSVKKTTKKAAAKKTTVKKASAKKAAAKKTPTKKSSAKKAVAKKSPAKKAAKKTAKKAAKKSTKK